MKGFFHSCFFLILTTLLSCYATELAEDTLETATEEPLAQVATIPSVGLATAVAGRLPLRRKANGLLRARREIIVKSLNSDLLTTAPQGSRDHA
jgi:hypothetical protein